MGIKLLNKFIRQHCNDDSCIKKIHLSEMKGKKIAVDTSIFLYRFKGDQALCENFYNMCSIFLQYNITPLFIFDGKPPKEKEDELKKRHEEKKSAEEEYDRLIEDVKDIKDPVEREEMLQKINELQKKFIRIKKNDISTIKHMIQGFGMSYVDAPGEADVLCAALMQKKKVHAVLSEDMDLFVYGCQNILRYFSLIQHSAVLYKTPNIIERLHMEREAFMHMCILAGTDYNSDEKKQGRRTIFDYYKKFTQWRVQMRQKERMMSTASKESGVDSSNNKSVNNVVDVNDNDNDTYLGFVKESFDDVDVDAVQHIMHMYDIDFAKIAHENIIKNVMIKNTSVNQDHLKDELTKEGFVFL